MQSLLDHPHVLKLFGAFEDATYIYLVLQLAHGDLHRKYLAKGVRLTDRELVRAVVQPLLTALRHAHSRGIIHR